VRYRLRTTGPVRIVVGDRARAPEADWTSARRLAQYSDARAEHGAAWRVAETHTGVRDLWRAEGVETQGGCLDRLTSVADVVNRVRRESRAQ
jgi:hypothetical protein